MSDSSLQNSKRKSAEYVVVARRYRPQQFDELIGQEHVAGALANAIDANRTGHAYLFAGARGVGKTSAARILAKALNCVHGPSVRSCGDCEICRDISTGHDVDVLEIDGASNRGIDEIRQLRQNVNIRPSRARFKIYIIDEVHMLTREAFNALLKTLEEPPEHVKFIFCTTEPNKIPVTVLSRCQQFEFAGIRQESIKRRLQQIVESEGLEAEPEALDILARRAGGSMRDSQSLLEQLLASSDKKLTAEGVHSLLGTADDTRLIEMVDCIVSSNTAKAMAVLDSAIIAAIDIGQFLEQLMGVFRDMMAAKVGCPDDQLMSFSAAEMRSRLRIISDQVSLETVLAMLQILDSTLARFRVTTQRRTLAEIAVVRLANIGDLEELSSLLAQVATGEEIRLPRGNVTVPPRATYPPPAEKQQQDGPDLVSGDSLAEDFAMNRKTKSTGADSHDSAELTSQTAVMERHGEFVLNSSNCEAVWHEATESLGGLLASAAGEGRAAIRAPNHLAVTFSRAYNKSICEQAENLAKIKSAIARFGSAAIEVQFEVDASTETLMEEPSPQPVSQHQKVFEVAEHPLVKRAQELFGANVRKVD